MSQFNFKNLESRFNQLGEDLQGFVGRIIEDASESRRFVPKTDCFTENDKMIFLIDLPGMDSSQVSITLKDSLITVSGERDVALPEGSEVKKKERQAGRFSRSFSVSAGVKSSDIKAAFKSGVLRIEVPVPEQDDDNEEIVIETDSDTEFK